MKIKTRKGTTADIEFLRKMLFEAAFWRPKTQLPSIEEGLSHSELAKILHGWGCKGDTAAVAESIEGEPIGAAWYRFWTDKNHSFGYVHRDVPELGIGVVAAERNKGIGSALLKELFRIASTADIKKISLSVERDNPARHLYLKFNFKKVGSLDNALTMVAKTGV